MKFLLDENIPVSVLKFMKQSGFDAMSVLEFSGINSDIEIIRAAHNEKRIIITFDRDFGELVYKTGIKSFGIMYLRFEPVNTVVINRQISAVLEEKSINFSKSFVIIEKDKVRVRLLPE